MARKLKPKDIYISEDFAEETVRKRTELLPKLKEVKELTGEDSIFCGGQTRCEIAVSFANVWNWANFSLCQESGEYPP